MQAKGIEPAPAQRYRRAAGEEFGYFVLDARRRAGLTQEQLAERLLERQTYVSRIERGEHCPRLDTLVRVITALEADPRKLVEVVSKRFDEALF